MKEISLTQGKMALVDDSDYEELGQWKWYAMRTASHRDRWCAARCVPTGNGRQANIYMHRAILKPASGVFIDHIDGDGLNNQRSNLRLATNQENCRNQRVRRNNTTGYKGVFKWHNRWGAKIQEYYLGLFNTPEEAATAYNEAANELFGEYARFNVIGRKDEKVLADGSSKSI